MLAFRILGPLEVASERGLIRLGGPKQRSVLAMLLLDVSRVVSIERLAEDLYAGAPPVTAVTQIHRQISELRKALGSEAPIETRAPGYMIRLHSDQFDLNRFERTTEAARGALDQGEHERAAELLRAALGLWRGEPLADLASEPFASPAIRRLEELRLSALEQRIAVDLLLGRHESLVAEIESLCTKYPLREQLHARLILALYRSGRQAEALGAYRNARAILVDELGVEPTPALRELERAILRQDASLELGRPETPALSESKRAVLVMAEHDTALDPLVEIGLQLVPTASRELIVARFVAEADDLERAASDLETKRATLPGHIRTAVLTTGEPERDCVRLATNFDVELVLVAAPEGTTETLLPEALVKLLEMSPADVGILAGPAFDLSRGSGVFVPFGGAEHEWAALEIGARIAVTNGASAPARRHPCRPATRTTRCEPPTR